MNSVELIGRLTRDPEKHNGSVSFTIAVDRNGKDAGADYPRIVVFNKTAEIVEKYFKKGRLVSVQGRIRTSSYEGKNGIVHTTDVVGDDVRVLDWGAKKPAEKEEAPKDVPSEFEAIDEDVPF